MATDDEGRPHVLVPLDGSPLAEKALELALETFDGPVTVLSVLTPLDAGMSESGVLERSDSDASSRDSRAERVVDAVLARTDANDRHVEIVLETGQPAETILGYVDEHDVDHVVIGGHGGELGTVARIVGTVAIEVVTESPVPVTVVH
ncbi:MAG: universal stress protein [Halodesulfurarchaeum sp.]